MLVSYDDIQENVMPSWNTQNTKEKNHLEYMSELISYDD